MKVYVDQSCCIGCGLCIYTCSEIFQLDESDKAKVISVPTAQNKAAVEEAIQLCPVGAISENDHRN